VTVDRKLLSRYFRQLAELGVDEVVLDTMTADEALRLLARRPARAAHTAPAPTVQTASAPPPTAQVPAVPAPTVAPGRARWRPHAEARLAGLGGGAAACRLCRLHEGRSRVVFGEGDALAAVAVVGEAPGQEEDRTGRPFVGPAGRLLDLLLMSAGFPRETVYICNVLKCRPPGNRDPLPDEVAACTTNYLQPQLDAIAPRVVLALGRFAAQALLDSEQSLGRLRGVVHGYRGVPLIVTYHPAYLLRTPQMTRAAWQDIQLLRKVLDEQA
jgi:uracil-DNA glycosylase